MHVPVKDRQGHIRLLHVSEETIFLQIDRNGELVFHTTIGEFPLIRRVEEWAVLLADTDFLRVDRGTIVNFNKHWLFAPELRVLRYRDDQRLLQIPISEKSIAKIKRYTASMSNKGNDFSS